MTTLSEDTRDAYSVKEVLQILPLGRSTIYDLVASGELRSRKVGKKIIIPKSAIEELLQRQKINTRPNRQELTQCPN